MSSATERLRELLDERGVEWMPSVFDPQHETFYSTENGVGFIVTEFPEIGRMSLVCDMRITPEQAVEATLGPLTERATKDSERDSDERGECRARLYKPEHGSSDCTICECGEINDISANYCNRCGRQIKVVSE